ncbi:MAG TPA: FUSC family protein [Geomonas sp.]|nr:FUSC family protein [Geomonas sp.]
MVESSATKGGSRWPALRREIIAWGQQHIFVLKTPLAALIAMLIAMRLELDQPRTAMITVFVVMQPQTGLVLAKSLYRIAGTLAGTFASLVLVGQFAQEPEMFIVGLACWVGLCTAGAAFYRNFRSYAFVLAGYTAALIGLPAAVQPAAFFSLATTRLSEIALGILCAGICSDALFPRRLSDAVIRNVERRYTDFIALVRGALSGSASREKLAKRQLRLMEDVIGLESIREAAALDDAEIRARDLRLRRLNKEFMAVSATFHSFHQLLRRLTENATPAGLALGALYESLGETLVQKAPAPSNAAAARQAARSIALFRRQLSRRVDRVRLTVLGLNDPRTLMDFETAVELLYRFVRDLHLYTSTYATLSGRETEAKPPDDIRFASRTDWLLAFASGSRAFLGILLVGSFWIASAWPYGISALTFVTIVSALCSSAPDPSQTAKQMVLGFCCGFLPALVFKFFMLPALDGWLLLAATMAPFLILGSYLSSTARWSGIGAGFLVFFTSMTSPTNPALFDPVDVINDGIGTIIGVAVAGILFATLVPSSGAWFRRRLARLLRRQVVRACSGPLEGLSHRFESGTHDLLHTLTAIRKEGDGKDASLLAWVFPVIEIGRAMISLRKDAAFLATGEPLAGRVRESIASIGRLFDRPSEARRYAALCRVTEAIRAVSREAQAAQGGGPAKEALRRVLTSLHLIRTVLREEELVLASASPGQQTTISGELINAA